MLVYKINKEQELWLELYKYISDKNNHTSIEAVNVPWQSPSIKLVKTHLVSNWASLEDEWETAYIESDSNTCNNFIDCLSYVVDKLKRDDWTY